MFVWNYWIWEQTGPQWLEPVAGRRASLNAPFSAGGFRSQQIIDIAYGRQHSSWTAIPIAPVK
jgi:hypothetical protein